jgi:transposase-like protein
MPEASVLIVGNDPAAVEADLIGGRMACPGCGGVLRRWGHARQRILHRLETTEWLRPRRGICAGCGATHVLLAEDTLLRRRDAVEVIGAALTAKAAGSGHRSIAAELGREPSKVRRWFRRFASMAEEIRAHFTRWAHALDPVLGPVVPTGSAFADAVEAIGTAASAAVRRLGPRPPWQLASVLSGGGLLATRSDLWPASG